MTVAGAEFETLQGWIDGENAGRVRQIAGMWTEAQAAFTAEGAALQGARSPLEAGGWKGEAATTFSGMQQRTEQSFAAAEEGVGQVAAQLGEIADVIDRVKLTMQGLRDEWNQRMASVNNPVVEKISPDVTGSAGTGRVAYRVSIDGQSHTFDVPAYNRDAAPSDDVANGVRNVVDAARENVRQNLTERARDIMLALERTYTDRSGTLLSVTPSLLFNGPRNANASGLDLGPAPGAGGTGAPVRGAGREGRGPPAGAINPNAGAASAAPQGATGLPPGAIDPDVGLTAAQAPDELPPGAIRPIVGDAGVGYGRIRLGGAGVPDTSPGLAPGAIRSGVSVGDASSGTLGPARAGTGLDPAALGLGPAVAGFGPAATGLLRTTAGGAALEAGLPPGAIRPGAGGPQTPPMPLTPSMAGRQGASRMPGSAARTAPGSTVPPGTPSQLGGRRSGGEQRETSRARGASRRAQPAGTARDDMSLPRIAGRAAATPVAAVRMPDLPGSVAGEPALTVEAPAPQLGRLGPAPAQPAHQERELGGRRRTATDDVVLATNERAGTALNARTAPTGVDARPAIVQRRRRGIRPVQVPERPNEEVWRSGDGAGANRADAIVDTPTPPAAEQAQGPALGRDRVVQAS